MRRKVAEDSIPDVAFAGFLNQSEISKAYASADIFVLPSSHDETWGLVVNEAMNFALPIIVSDKVGSGRDLVRNGENGFTFSAGNVNMLTSCLEALVKSADLRHSFGQTSLGIIDGWSHEVAAKGIVDAVRDSVGERRWSEAEAC
jgi:glycosyltransferase involved in cell wall biosynthesis